MNFYNDEWLDVDEIDDEEAMKRLTFPFTKHEPDVSAEQLMELDALADSLEIKRLFNLGVLTSKDEAPADAKSLSTRFVRTWREKVVSGSKVWLRRSRFVAREFAWLQPDRDALFSPASSSIVARLLPAMYLDLKDREDAIMASIEMSKMPFSHFLKKRRQRSDANLQMARQGTSVWARFYQGREMAVCCGTRQSQEFWNLIWTWKFMSHTRASSRRLTTAALFWSMWTTFWLLVKGSLWWNVWWSALRKPTPSPLSFWRNPVMNSVSWSAPWRCRMMVDLPFKFITSMYSILVNYSSSTPSCRTRKHLGMLIWIRSMRQRTWLKLRQPLSERAWECSFTWHVTCPTASMLCATWPPTVADPQKRAWWSFDILWPIWPAIRSYVSLSNGVAAMLECTIPMTTWSQASVFWKFSQTVTGQVTADPDGPFHVQQFSWVDAFCFCQPHSKAGVTFFSRSRGLCMLKWNLWCHPFESPCELDDWKTYGDMAVYRQLRRPWNFAKTWSWTSAAFILQNPLATSLGGNWNSQAVFNSRQHQPCWCGNKTPTSSKNAFFDVNFGHVQCSDWKPWRRWWPSWHFQKEGQRCWPDCSHPKRLEPAPSSRLSSWWWWQRWWSFT